MSFVPLVKRIARIDPSDGEPVYFYTGTHETGDTLPTDHVEQGSWSMNLDSKDVAFFNADTESWG